MIPLNTEQHLGSRALIVIILRRISLAIIFFILMLLAVPVRSALLNWLNTSITTATMSDQAINSITAISAIVIALLFILTLIFLFFGFIMAFLECKTYTFTFEEFDLKMRRGILGRRENSIPFRQIQDVDIEQSILYRLFGLSRLVIITAGH